MVGINVSIVMQWKVFKFYLTIATVCKRLAFSNNL